MAPDLNDQEVADATAYLRAEATRGVQPAQLNAVADQLEQIADAIKRGDQTMVNNIGPNLLINHNQLPISESPHLLSKVKPIIEKLLSHSRLQPPGPH
jgi:hypothetical protein